MKVKVDIINKLLERVWSGQTTITETTYFPKFEYKEGEFIQVEAYNIKYEGDRPNQVMCDEVKKYLGIELIWEDDIIPLIPYEK